MSISEQEYKRLPGGSVFRPNRLYLGQDHLLRVNSNGWTEQYRRFYFTDIEGVIVRKTFWGLIANIAWGALALLFAILLITTSNWDDRVGFGIVTGIALFFLFINFL